MSIDTKIKIHPSKNKPSEKLMSMINELVDTGLKFQSVWDELWEQGTKEGFSKEEIADIIRPIAKAKGLNKDQVYYLTHKPQRQEDSRRQYQELMQSRNITTDEEPKPDTNRNSYDHEDRPQTQIQIPVEEFRLEDLEKYSRDFLIKIINYLCINLEVR